MMTMVVKTGNVNDNSCLNRYGPDHEKGKHNSEPTSNGKRGTSLVLGQTALVVTWALYGVSRTEVGRQMLGTNTGAHSQMGVAAVTACA